MTNRTRKWLRAGLETLIHGSTAAIVSTLTASFVDGKDWAIGGSNFFKLLIGSFLGNGGIRFFQWWSNNPLPPEDSDFVDASGQSLVPQAVISLNPMNKVQSIAPSEPPKP